MKIARDSLIVRYAYLGGDIIPSSTTVCALFWRCVALSTLKWILIAVLGPIFACIYFGERFMEWLRERRDRRTGGLHVPRVTLKERIRESAVADVAFAVKHRICPVIYIERSDEASGVTK